MQRFGRFNRRVVASGLKYTRDCDPDLLYNHGSTLEMPFQYELYCYAEVALMASFRDCRSVAAAVPVEPLAVPLTAVVALLVAFVACCILRGEPVELFVGDSGGET
jgi:hypothetical protein